MRYRSIRAKRSDCVLGTQQLQARSVSFGLTDKACAEFFVRTCVYIYIYIARTLCTPLYPNLVMFPVFIVVVRVASHRGSSRSPETY